MSLSSGTVVDVTYIPANSRLISVQLCGFHMLMESHTFLSTNDQLLTIFEQGDMVAHMSLIQLLQIQYFWLRRPLLESLQGVH